MLQEQKVHIYAHHKNGTQQQSICIRDR